MKRLRNYILGIDSTHQYMFWYRYKGAKLQNFGDLIGPYLFKELCGISVRHIEDKPALLSTKYIPHYLTVGSILSSARKSSIIWGSGIIRKDFDINTKARYLAVRGPKTRNKIIEQGGACPEIYGDPAILLPLLSPLTGKKEAKITFIPHYVDYEQVQESLINKKDVDVVRMMTADFSRTLGEIKSSNFIISSSLHGLILAVAYNIPCLWVEFSDKIYGDDVKYYDFFESLDIQGITKYIVDDPCDFLTNLSSYIPIIGGRQKLRELQNGLLNSCPFPVNKVMSTI